MIFMDVAVDMNAGLDALDGGEEVDAADTLTTVDAVSVAAWWTMGDEHIDVGGDL